MNNKKLIGVFILLSLVIDNTFIFVFVCYQFIARLYDYIKPTDIDNVELILVSGESFNSLQGVMVYDKEAGPLSNIKVLETYAPYEEEDIDNTVTTVTHIFQVNYQV